MTTDPVDLSEEYRALLRRDWAVRVLDAQGSWEIDWTDKGWVILDAERITLNKRREDSQESSRHAAAQAVLPTLPEAVRTELGECP